MEEWKMVEGYEDSYEVSNYGRVRSLDRYVRRADGIVQFKKGREITAVKNKDGYCNVKLSKCGKSRTVKVHRLVAEAFVEKPKDFNKKLYEVNHIDCKRDHNAASNLEWMLHKDNIDYSISMGKHICTTDLRGANNPNYGNRILSARYKNNPGLTAKIFGRHGSQNGRAQKVLMYDLNLTQVCAFEWIGGCAQYLVAVGATKATNINGIRDRISHSIKHGVPYLNYFFKKA